jgi:hypothetical protein
MFSKFAILATLALLPEDVSALPMVVGTYDAARKDGSQEAGYGCAECLLSGWNYVTDKWGSTDLTNYSGYCCINNIADNTCVPASVFTAAAFVGAYKESKAMNKEIAVSKCPQKTSVCGSTASFKFANTADNEKSVSVSK